MKDEIAKNNWATKKGMQMVQNLNDEERETSQNSTDDESCSEAGNHDNNKKRVHWSGVQMQGFQMCIHVQHYQNMGNENKTLEQNHTSKKGLASEEVN